MKWVFKRCLPVKAEFNQWHIEDDPFFPLCETVPETETHILFHFEKVVGVCQMLELWCVFDNSLLELNSWFHFIDHMKPPRGCERIFIIAWTVWFHHNWKVHENINFNINEITWQVKKSMVEAQLTKVGSLLGAERSWLAALGGWMKMNCDVTVDETGRTGVGVVVWDASGTIKVFLALPNQSCYGVFHIESSAIAEGLRKLCWFCASRFIVEIDASQVVEAILEGKCFRSEPWTHITTTRLKLVRFTASHVAHCYR